MAPNLVLMFLFALVYCVFLLLLLLLLHSCYSCSVGDQYMNVLIFNMTSAARSVSVYPPRGVCGCLDRVNSSINYMYNIY